MYEFPHIYLKSKDNEKAKLCFMDTDSFIVYIKTDDIYKDIAEDFETRFDTWINEDELGEKIMTRLVGLRPKTYTYLIDYSSNDKKAKNTN